MRLYEKSFYKILYLIYILHERDKAIKQILDTFFVQTKYS